MTKLLINEEPLMVLPGLAKKIGLNEAIILQQIHYWNLINEKRNNNYKDGYYWTFNSITQWQEQFPFWSTRTIQRAINNLEKMKLIVTSNYNKLKIDRTKWYRIDYVVLSTLERSPLGQNGTINMTEWLNELDKLVLPLPENNSESTSEINKKNKGTEQDSARSVFSFNDFKNYTTLNDIEKIEVVEHYLDCYKQHIGKEHPKLKKEQWDHVVEDLFYISDGGIDFDLDESAMKDMIDQHFKTTYQEGCDYNILHFMSDRVRMNRMYEVAY